MRSTPGTFKLPPEVTFTKERLAGAWAYVFRHAQLGELGRILLQQRPDDRTQVTCEVVGDPADPMTKERAAIFEPSGLVLARQLDSATGGTGEETWARPPVRPPEPRQRIASKLMQCERCGAPVALLIFADQATDLGGLEDYARLMYAKVVELEVPTWVIGPPTGEGPPAEEPSAMLKIWPAREPVCQVSPAAFNPVLEHLIRTHCR